jgi:hypothetical protein
MIYINKLRKLDLKEDQIERIAFYGSKDILPEDIYAGLQNGFEVDLNERN